MVCIYCKSDTFVINSRHQKRLNNIWRRRKCTSCTAIFTTSESPDLLKGLSVLHNGRLQPFSRDKLFLSVHDSVKHRKTATGDATALTDTIIAHLYSTIRSGSVDIITIIKCASKILKRFDKAASSHYQAFHPEKL